MKRSTLRHP